MGRIFSFDNSNRIELFCNRLLDADLDLYYCGMENCIPEFTCGPHARYNFLIHYITNGKGYYEFNNSRYELEEGDIFVIFPGDITFYATYKEDPWSFCWFAFNGKKAMELLKNCGLSRNAPVKHLLKEYALDGLVQECINAFPKKGEPLKIQLQGYLYLIFSKMQENHLHTEHTETEKPGFMVHIEKALLYIDYNFLMPIKVQDIAAYINLDRTYFSKIFRIATGLSPQEYLMSYRIEKAAKLIEKSELSFKQIGISVGIPNEYYFSKLFKTIKGIPPNKYRSQLKAHHM